MLFDNVSGLLSILSVSDWQVSCSWSAGTSFQEVCNTARYLSQRSIPVFCTEVSAVFDEESDTSCDKGLVHHATTTKDAAKRKYTNFVDIREKIRR